VDVPIVKAAACAGALLGSSSFTVGRSRLVHGCGTPVVPASVVRVSLSGYGGSYTKGPARCVSLLPTPDAVAEIRIARQASPLTLSVN
jgi:hypothetical protein